MHDRPASSYRTWVVDRAPTMLRLAHQMLGDPHAAVDVACDALARRGLSARAPAVTDEKILRDLSRAALRRQTADGVSPSMLDDLAPRERVATVLAFGQGWDPDGVAEVMGTTPGRARAVVRHALARRDEAAWRAALADPAWALDMPADFVDRCAAVGRARRSRRRTRLLAVGAAVLVVTGGAVAGWRLATAPAPLPPTAHVAGLLSWPPRGDLVRDRRLRDAAIAVWRRGSTEPLKQPFVLYAGHVGVGRLVVLQAPTPDGHAQVAVVADHDVSFGHARLHLDLVAPLRLTDVPVLLVPYNGNLNLPGLAPGPGSQVVQLLAAPGIDAVEQRRVLQIPFPPVDWPGFTPQRLDGGLSDPWLDLSGDRPATVVRAWQHGRVVFTGLVTPGALQPAQVRPQIVTAPGAWPARQQPVDRAAVATDAVLWSQVCHSTDPLVQPVWQSTAFPVALRLEFVRCPGWTPLHAEFVMGAGDSQRWLADLAGPADAYVLRIPAPRGARIVVVASVKARRIVVGPQVFSGQVAVVPAPSGAPVQVLDGAGRPLPTVPGR